MLRASLKRGIAFVIALLLVAAVYVGLSLHSTPGTKGSGPFSSFPAAWLNPCSLPVHGNITTSNGVVSQFAPGLANFSLNRVYSSIVGSSGFKTASDGEGWDTGSWILTNTGAAVGGNEVQGTFILLSGGQPDGYVIADYLIENGSVTATRQTILYSFGCPANPNSSTEIRLDKETPAYYPQGQPVKVIFEVNNNYSASSTLSFSANSSCLGQFDVYGNVSGAYSVVYHSSEHGACGTSPLSVVLPSNETYTQVRQWNQTFDNGTQVPAGIYRVEANMTAVGVGRLTDSGGEVFLGTPVPVNATVFDSELSFSGLVHDSQESLGTPVELQWSLSNHGSEIYDVQSSPCSFSYEILNFTNAVVYDSPKDSVCCGQLNDGPLPPQGGLSQTLYWNDTNSLGQGVGPGLYQALLHLNVSGGGRQFNASQTAYFYLEKPGPAPDHIISIQSSSLCASGCANGTPSLNAGVYANGNLKSLALYVNGTYVGTTNYSLPCCQFTYSVNLASPLSSQEVRITAGVTYDVLLVGSFSDGETSADWAAPVAASYLN